MTQLRNFVIVVKIVHVVVHIVLRVMEVVCTVGKRWNCIWLFFDWKERDWRKRRSWQWNLFKTLFVDVLEFEAWLWHWLNVKSWRFSYMKLLTRIDKRFKTGNVVRLMNLTVSVLSLGNIRKNTNTSSCCHPQVTLSLAAATVDSNLHWDRYESYVQDDHLKLNRLLLSHPLPISQPLQKKVNLWWGKNVNEHLPWSAWIAWASSLLSSSVFIVTKRRTSKLREAATIANPKRIKTRANMTYSGRLLSELSFWSATISPNPIVVSVMKQLQK